MMGLEIFWFIVIAVFWTGFFILEGFDLGVGALHMLVGRTDVERRMAISSIGPFWDANEVWLIVAVAGMFAAFPSWYASMLSAMYLMVMLILLALIVRGVSFEYRNKATSPAWRATWDWTLTIGSALLPLLLGIGLGDLLYGLPINQSGTFTGSFLDLFTPFGVWFGVTLLALTLAHGATYLSLKTTGAVQERSQRLAMPFVWVAALAVLGAVTWTHVQSGRGVIPAPVEVAAFLLIVAAGWSIRDKHLGWGFTLTTATISMTLVSLWVALYPDLMISSTNKAYNLTVSNSASGHYALTLMTIIAAVFAPLVIAYQAWSYHVFWGRVTGLPVAARQVPEPTGNGPGPAGNGPAGNGPAVNEDSPVSRPESADAG